MSPLPRQECRSRQRRRYTLGAGALALSPLGLGLPGTGSAQASAYPVKPIRLVVGYPPGGSADVLARIVAAALTQSLGQSVVVENQPGASGNIAAQSVARASADGYTLLMGNTAEISINKLLMKDAGFDPHADLIPIALVYNLTPSRTPTDIVALLNREVNKAYDNPDVRAKITGQYSQVIKYTPEQFANFLRADSDRYRDVIQQTGIALR